MAAVLLVLPHHGRVSIQKLLRGILQLRRLLVAVRQAALHQLFLRFAPETSFSRIGVRIVPPTTVMTTGVIIALLRTPMDRPRLATINATSPRQTMPTPT